MDEYIVFVAVIILIGLWNVMIAVFGRFPQFCATTMGTLTKANSKKNVRTRRGGIIPMLTNYAYVYTVNGRQYRYSDQGLHGKRRLLPKAPMVYVKWLPWRAYPYKFKGTTEWVLGLTFLFMGIVCIVAMVSGQ